MKRTVGRYTPPPRIFAKNRKRLIFSSLKSRIISSFKSLKYRNLEKYLYSLEISEEVKQKLISFFRRKDPSILKQKRIIARAETVYSKGGLKQQPYLRVFSLLFRKSYLFKDGQHLISISFLNPKNESKVFEMLANFFIDNFEKLHLFGRQGVKYIVSTSISVFRKTNSEVRLKNFLDLLPKVLDNGTDIYLYSDEKPSKSYIFSIVYEVVQQYLKKVEQGDFDSLKDVPEIMTLLLFADEKQILDDAEFLFKGLSEDQLKVLLSELSRISPEFSQRIFEEVFEKRDGK